MVLTRLERLVTLARRVRPAGRRRRRPLLGRGIEPGARREYAPGDDLRFVDWPAYARLERLLIKVQEELPEPRLDLVLDGSGSMGCGHPRPYDRASLAAAALAACGVARGVRVDLWFAGEPLAHTDLRRPGRLVHLLRFLSERTPRGDSSQLERSVRRVCEQSRLRGGAVLLSDGLDPRATAQAAARLSRASFSTLVAAVGAAELAPAAAALADASGLVELVDSETGERRQVPFSRVALDVAARARTARRADLARRLEEVGVSLEVLEPEAPFEAVALGLLSCKSA
jgi:uncharacterized protein (DUF58 family)